ncbi:6-bladed beta-propeller [Thermincola potens]|uniref:NHL repeat containing protein n=1 Tax=Thermincola potens (strain JR) TaxID=635013 RepID=D5XE80_THEPJ|nr:6-bladed beta-propeller [Thermincola potens]ADG81951.1 NHL repeat containing protein [Thermincola potens JR]
MTDRQRQLKISLLLAVGITIVCGFITWLIFNKSEQTFSSPSGFGQRLPEVAYKFTIGGDGSTGPYKLSEPMAVDVADNGDIYVADTLNNQIKIFDKEGKFKKSFGGRELFYLPSDLVIGPEGIFVADSKNSRIQLFSLEGDFRKTFVSPEIGRQIGAMIPVALYCSSDGTLYVTDVFYQRVIIFDPKGQVVKYFGMPGSREGNLLYPNGITVNEKKKLIYVADSNNGRIQVFDLNGQFKGILKEDGRVLFLNMPRGIVTFDDIVFTVETFSHRVSAFRTDGANVLEKAVFGSRGLGDDQMNFPNDIALKGNVLCVADRANDRVLVYELK